MIVSTAARAARPHALRAAAAGLVAVAGLTVASLGELVARRGEPDPTAADRTLAIVGAAVLLLAGVVAVRAAAAAVRAAAGEQLGDKRAKPLGLVVSVVGYALVILSALGALGINMSGLLLGGALTGVILGIAAQQSLGNFFAGLVLLFVRPFTVAEHVVLRAASLGGEYEGTVTNMGLFYVTLVTEQGPVVLPNAGVLAAAIGPGARTPKDEDKKQEEENQAAADQGPAHGGPA